MYKITKDGKEYYSDTLVYVKKAQRIGGVSVTAPCCCCFFRVLFVVTSLAETN